MTNDAISRSDVLRALRRLQRTYRLDTPEGRSARYASDEAIAAVQRLPAKREGARQCKECGLNRVVGTCDGSKWPHCRACCRKNGGGIKAPWKPKPARAARITRSMIPDGACGMLAYRGTQSCVRNAGHGGRHAFRPAARAGRE